MNFFTDAEFERWERTNPKPPTIPSGLVLALLGIAAGGTGLLEHPNLRASTLLYSVAVGTGLLAAFVYVQTLTRVARSAQVLELRRAATVFEAKLHKRLAEQNQEKDFDCEELPSTRVPAELSLRLRNAGFSQVADDITAIYLRCVAAEHSPTAGTP